MASKDPGMRIEGDTPKAPKKPKKPAKVIQGFEWSTLPDVNETLELCLWNAGVLTKDDLNTKPQAAIGAFQAYYGLDLAKLRQLVKENNHG